MKVSTTVLVKGALAFMFGAVGIQKVTGMVDQRQLFWSLGYPTWCMAAVGLAEIAAALAVFIDATAGLSFVAFILGGAMHAHAVLQGQPVAAVVPVVVLAWVMWAAWLSSVHWACVLGSVPFGFLTAGVLHTAVGSTPVKLQNAPPTATATNKQAKQA